jgi:predicted dehydrogenase
MPIRVAVIGAGHMGRIHIQKLNALPDVEIAGVVDLEYSLAENMAKVYGVYPFTSYEKLLGKVEGVIIATPTETHYSVAKAFLSGGAHVFIEKPITLTPAEGRRLIRMAEMLNLRLQVGHIERFNPAFQEAVRLITRPLFIDACRLSPFTGRSTDVDVIHDLMIHDIDLLLALTRGKVKRVEADGVCLVSNKFDMANARIKLADGAVASLTASRMATGRERSVSVYEKDGYFFIDLLNAKLTHVAKNEAGDVTTTEYPAENPDPVKDEITEFIQSVQGFQTPTVSGEDGLSALILADRITDTIARQTSL